MYWAVSLLFEIVKESMVLFGVFRIKPAGKRRVIIAFAIFIAGEIIALVVNVPQSKSNFVLFTMAVSFIACFIALSGKRKILNLIFAFIATNFLTALLLGSLTLFTGLRADVIANTPFYMVIGNCLSILILFVATIISNRLYFEKVFQKLNIKHYIVFIFGVFSCAVQIVSLQLIISTNTYGSQYKNVSLVGINLSGIIFVLVCASYIISDMLKRKYMEVSEINQKLLEQIEKKYEILIEKNKQILKIQHEFNHHIASIDYFVNTGQGDKLKKYLAELKKKSDTPQLEIDAGNDLINAIINDLHDKYPDIQIVCESIIPEKLNMPDTDICAIFYNLFENAFEATEKIFSDRKKVITISSNYLMQSLVIKIKNPVEEKVLIKNNIPKTTKKDKWFHGHGISNVHDIVERNGGVVKFDCDDNEFSVALIYDYV